MTGIQQSNAKSIMLEFAPDEKVTSLGGMTLLAPLMRRPWVTTLIEKTIPYRRAAATNRPNPSAGIPFIKHWARTCRAALKD